MDALGSIEFGLSADLCGTDVLGKRSEVCGTVCSYVEVCGTVCLLYAREAREVACGDVCLGEVVFPRECGLMCVGLFLGAWMSGECRGGPMVC